jgi:hypothetical protein
MLTAAHSSRTAGPWFLLGCLMVAACTDSTAPGPAPAVKLAFMMQPSSTTAGVSIEPVVAIAIEDASGHTVTGATNVVTVTLAANPGGDTLKGTASVAAVDGIATFSTLRIDKTGAGYTLQAAATGLTGATSTPFTIAAAPASQLVFTVPPNNAMGGAAISPPVQVAAQDPYGNLVTGFQDSVTVALADSSPPGALSGTTVVSAIGGVATFSDLSITLVGLGYTLTASAAGLTGVTSAPFSIATPTATLRITAGTSGEEPDTDGYAGCVDPASAGHGATACGYGGPVAVAGNGSATVTVDTGAHAVLLTDIAANCRVTGDNPSAVLRAAPGDTVVVPFAVVCVPVTLHVTTATTGVSLDPDGYTVCIDPVSDWDFGYDCTISQTIGVNDSLTVPVTPGTHVVWLDDVAGNCAVSGGGTVSSTDVPFAITCVAAGSVRVTTVTSGTDIPAGVYHACLDSSGGCFDVGANAVATHDGVLPGPHTVTLDVVATNCTVSGGTTRAFTVSQDATADLAFEVACLPVGQIAFSSAGAIALIRTDGQALHSITTGTAPAWSPDGTRLAYECGEDICAINADGSGFAQLTVNPAGNHHPTWAPDGSRIAFAATYAGVVDLYVMGADGTGVARLTQGVGFVGSPAWSPDGAKIVFDCQVEAGNDDICSVNADGTGFARLTTDPARDDGAAWKPDGSTLAFTTTRYGADEIVLMSPAGGSVTRIGAGLPGFAPTWSADGSRLAFVRGTGPASYIVVAWADGSNNALIALTAGDQPAWQPHP